MLTQDDEESDGDSDHCRNIAPLRGCLITTTNTHSSRIIMELCPFPEGTTGFSPLQGGGSPALPAKGKLRLGSPAVNG